MSACLHFLIVKHHRSLGPDPAMFIITKIMCRRRVKMVDFTLISWQGDDVFGKCQTVPKFSQTHPYQPRFEYKLAVLYTTVAH